jgi:DNA-binding transcriptional LysR family regulator
MTKTIQKLEQETGTLLFERTTRRVVLTEAGEAVLRRAREVLHHVDEIPRDLDELKNTVAGELRIGAMEVFSIRTLPNAIAAVVAAHPSVVPLVYEMHPESIHRHVADGLLDVGFTIGPAATDENRSESIGKSPARIVCGRSHPLYRKARISRAALSKYAFAVPRFFEREHLAPLDQFPERLYPRRVGATIELLQMLIELALAGRYLACVPEVSVARELSAGDLHVLHGLEGLPAFELRAITRRGVPPRKAALKLIEEIRRAARP